MQKNKIEKSNHYQEIITMLEAEKSPRYISNFLKQNYNEIISHTTINKFKKDWYRKLVVHDTNEIKRQQAVADTKTEVDVSVDCVEQIGRHFNKILELNDLSLQILEDGLKGDELTIHEKMHYANRCVELWAKYSLKEYAEVKITSNHILSGIEISNNMISDFMKLQNDDIDIIDGEIVESDKILKK